MDLLISTEELDALNGLSHIQQLAYLKGIRPYMDTKTGIVGIKRRISYQSISEQLYVEPHQGVKGQSFSRDQVRRAVSGLVRAGLITVQSDDMHLILKCELATQSYFVQNKAAINPPPKATTNPPGENVVDTGFSWDELSKADMAKSQKAAIPLIKDNYLYFLLQQFDAFWSLYPEKKSKPKAQAAFEQLNPDSTLFAKLMQALDAQIKHTEAMQERGLWVPTWKYPANWLLQRCWEDKVSMETIQEKTHAAHSKHTQNSEPKRDAFCPPDEEESPKSNVIQFRAS